MKRNILSVISLVLGLALAPSPAAAGEKPDFTLPDLAGTEHSLSDYRGRWVVVNYWATWCPPCLDEIPELVDFHEKHKERDAVVLGVNLEKIEVGELRGFVDDYFITYPILVQKPVPRTALGDVPGLPTTYVVSPEGEVVARQVGPLTGRMLEDFLAEMARERGEDASAVKTSQR